MTILWTNNKENSEGYYSAIQNDEFNLFHVYTGYNFWYLRRMIRDLRNIILLTDRMKDCLYPNLQQNNT